MITKSQQFVDLHLLPSYGSLNASAIIPHHGFQLCHSAVTPLFYTLGFLRRGTINVIVTAKRSGIAVVRRPGGPPSTLQFQPSTALAYRASHGPASGALTAGEAVVVQRAAVVLLRVDTGREGRDGAAPTPGGPSPGGQSLAQEPARLGALLQQVVRLLPRVRRQADPALERRRRRRRGGGGGGGGGAVQQRPAGGDRRRFRQRQEREVAAPKNNSSRVYSPPRVQG